MQAIKNRVQDTDRNPPICNLPALSVTKLKYYKDLQRFDEFETFYDRRLKRVRVVSMPQREGDRVRFAIAPVAGWGTPRPVTVTFQASASVQVFAERTVKPDRSYPTVKTDWLRAQIADTLTETLQSARQIGDTIRHHTGQRFDPALLDALLLEAGIVQRYRGLVRHHRKPITFAIGMPVSENLGRRSQRYGWVEKMQISRQHGAEFPVCRWLDGSFSFSSDDLLERVADPKMLTRIEQGKAILQGKFPEGFIELPLDLMQQFHHKSMDRSALLQLAKLIGLVHPDQPDLKGFWQVRSQVLTFLKIFYPEVIEQPK